MSGKVFQAGRPPPPKHCASPRPNYAALHSKYNPRSSRAGEEVPHVFRIGRSDDRKGRAPTESSASDAEQFAALQARLETAMEQCRDLRKELRPCAVPLHKHMLTHELTEMQCPPYVLRVESPFRDGRRRGGRRHAGNLYPASGVRFPDRRAVHRLPRGEPRLKRKRRMVCERNTTTSA